METSLSYIGLVVAWAAYLAVHSLLAARRVKAAVARRWPASARAYRLIYSLVAAVTLVPLVALTVALNGPQVVAWHGPAWWLAQAAALAAVLGFTTTVRGYDMGQFLGLGNRSAVTEDGRESWEPLRLTGLHRFVRHPWYFFGLVILWTRDLDLAGLVAVLTITVYLVVGSRLEERKLMEAYGDAYAAYRRRVPGLIPIPGRHLAPDEAGELARQANEGDPS
ncbi:methyltransferase family protein [Thiohalorhabdus sp.]|uniref:methyltransferase family protein n=1 Tax=Thiohalorhabdus sp. TaxID=3094134 RepID=UPI002FC39F9A